MFTQDMSITFQVQTTSVAGDFGVCFPANTGISVPIQNTFKHHSVEILWLFYHVHLTSLLIQSLFLFPPEHGVLVISSLKAAWLESNPCFCHQGSHGLLSSVENSYFSQHSGIHEDFGAEESETRVKDLKIQRENSPSTFITLNITNILGTPNQKPGRDKMFLTVSSMGNSGFCLISTSSILCKFAYSYGTFQKSFL